MKYIIQDWAGNEIREKTASGLLITPEFKTFEDGWDYIRTRFLNEQDWEDLYVVEKGA